MSKVVIPYKPRPLWGGKNGIHSELDKHRFSVIVAHRRFGKTLGVVNQLIKKAVLFKGGDGNFGYVAPYRNQAKAIAWDYLKRYTAVIPDVRYNESELSVVLPNGSKVRLYGADNADGLRGLYFDGLVIDEIADVKASVWGEILRPTLSDREGWCIFIGTPKGQNVFFGLYQKALSTSGWYAGVFRADETGVLSDGELLALKDEMTDSQYKQEMLCDFTASTDDCFIDLSCVLAAEKRSYKVDDVRHAPVVFGLDVARFGSDSSVLTRRQGLVVFEQLRFKGKDNMLLSSLVAREIERYKPDAVFVDAGRGEGVIDRLRQLGFSVVEVNFGSSALNPRYGNKRSEMWALMADWLKNGQLPVDAKLRQELTLPSYFFDANNRLMLESKKKMKERSSLSPDGADSLALTFAFPVGKRIFSGGKCMCNTDYNPLLR